MGDRGLARALRGERGRILVFVSAWILSLLLVWSLASASLPKPVPPAGSLGATLQIDGGGWTISYASHSANNTVFLLLREANRTLGFELRWVEYGWPYNDVFVTSINGTRNDQAGNLWWQYCVNGVYASQGAASQAVREGDAVRWVYATPGGDELCR